MRVAHRNILTHFLPMPATHPDILVTTFQVLVFGMTTVTYRIFVVTLRTPSTPEGTLSTLQAATLPTPSKIPWQVASRTCGFLHYWVCWPTQSARRWNNPVT